MKVNSLSWKIFKPILYKDYKKSEEYVKQFKVDNVFTSNTIEELYTDTFIYNGDKKNKLLVKNKLTGEPTEVSVEYNIKPMLSQEDGKKIEEIFLTDNYNNILGYKYFYVKNNKMYPGFMTTNESEYMGLGTRLDQMQIERALELNIKSIDRIALPKAIIYHIQRGFLPQSDLKCFTVKTHSDYKRINLDEFHESNEKLAKENFIPILCDDGENVFLDENWTRAVMAFNICKKKLALSNLSRITDDILSSNIHLSLNGNELNFWKSLIKDHAILPNIIKNIL